jgi:hypothetical protein
LHHPLHVLTQQHTLPAYYKGYPTKCVTIIGVVQTEVSFSSVIQNTTILES